MKKNDLLLKVLTAPMDENLRNDIVDFMFAESGKKPKGIPRLKNCQTALNVAEVVARMKAGAGGTCSSVATILGISAQAFNNQVSRKAISGNSLIDYHFKTGISIDWMVGSSDGSSSDYFYSSNEIVSDENENNDQHSQKYVSLVEVYDQSNGVNELKWCLTKHRLCLDNSGQQIEGDFAAMLSLIVRYRDSSGTPDRVKKSNKQYFQIRKILAYAKGDSKIMRMIDANAKKYTDEYRENYFDRPGKTEFRKYSSKEECLDVFAMLAEQHSVTLVKPQHDTIAWDYLIGAGCQTPQEWVAERFHASAKPRRPQLTANLTEADA